MGFSPKIRRGKKSFVLDLSLCRSRQILGYICRPIKGSWLTPHIQVRLTFLPCTIHIFLFKQISCLQSVVCNLPPPPLYKPCFFTSNLSKYYKLDSILKHSKVYTFYKHTFNFYIACCSHFFLLISKANLILSYKNVIFSSTLYDVTV